MNFKEKLRKHQVKNRKSLLVRTIEEQVEEVRKNLEERNVSRTNKRNGPKESTSEL